MTRRRLRGRPRWPVRLLTASRNGSTWARSSPLAGVVRLARGMPPPSVRLWSSIPWPFPPRAPPAPPPFPGGNSAIHGAILPTHHAALCCAKCLFKINFILITKSLDDPFNILNQGCKIRICPKLDPFILHKAPKDLNKAQLRGIFRQIEYR